MWKLFQLTLVASQSLLDLRRPYHGRTYFLPNNRRMGCIDETRLRASSSTIRFLGLSKLEFNFYKWARMWMKLMKEEDIKIRRVGFTFKNLNVSGSGPALNIQKDVGSVLMAPFPSKGILGLGSGRTAFVDEAVSLEECSISVCRTSFVTLPPFFLVFPSLPQITQHLGADDAGCQDSHWTQICFARYLAALLRRETVISLVH